MVTREQRHDTVLSTAIPCPLQAGPGKAAQLTQEPPKQGHATAVQMTFGCLRDFEVTSIISKISSLKRELLFDIISQSLAVRHLLQNCSHVACFESLSGADLIGLVIGGVVGVLGLALTTLYMLEYVQESIKNLQDCESIVQSQKTNKKSMYIYEPKL